MHSLAPEQALETLLQPRTLWATLWVGLALLTIALLVLMRTRWGQARPLSKCAILSLFAHLLLMGYASMTHIFLPQPAAPHEGVMEIEVVTEDDGQRTAPHESAVEADLPPWEQLAVEPPEISEPDQLARATPPRKMPEPQPDDSRPPAPRTQLPTAAIPAADVITDLPETAVAASHARTHQPIVAAAKIDPPTVRRQQPSEVVAPAPSRLARIPMARAPAKIPLRELASTPPRDQQVLADRLQRLAQLSPVTETSDAAPGNADQQSRATNRADTSWQGVDPARVGPQVTNPPEMAGGASGGRPATTLPISSPAAVANSSARMLAAAPTAIAMTVPSPSNNDALPEMYRNRIRVREQPGQLAQILGGTQETEAAVQAALAWLASIQNADGRFHAKAHGGGAQQFVEGEDRQGAGMHADAGVTALALLAFLAAGETHLKGKYRQNVQHGLEFLLRQQAADGNLAGNASTFAKMYCHGMAALALSEAYAMTKDDRIRPYLEQAIAYTVASQHPTGGGWRYQPWRHQTDDPGDMSQFGWQLMALKSAEAAGIEIPQRTSTLMRRFLGSCSSGRHGGLASYRPRENVTRPMTAEAFACRFFLNQNVNSATAHEAANYLAGDLPGMGRENLYYWYYGTLALFQLQDERWETWNRALQRQLLRAQRSGGQLSGSWDPNTVWGGCGGRVYSTAMATLCLEVYYRYLPLYERTHNRSNGP